MVILTALFCEYLELSPMSPDELLRGLADRVTSYSGRRRFHAQLEYLDLLAFSSIDSRRLSHYNAAHLCCFRRGTF